MSVKYTTQTKSATPDPVQLELPLDPTGVKPKSDTSELLQQMHALMDRVFAEPRHE